MLYSSRLSVLSAVLWAMQITTVGWCKQTAALAPLLVTSMALLYMGVARQKLETGIIRPYTS